MVTVTMMTTQQETMTSTALIVKPEWIERLLDPANPKTWEIRGSDTKKRGEIYFIPSKSSDMVGRATLVRSIPLTRELFESNMDKHQTESWDAVAGRYKRPHAWIFADNTRISPIPVERKCGAVVWAKVQARTGDTH